MSWLEELIKVLPILAELTDNTVDDLIAKLVARAEEEIERRENDTGKSRSEILAEASETYDRVLAKIEAGKKLGHET